MLNDELKALRVDGANLTQKELEAVSGLGREYISHLESFRGKDPRLSTLEKFCKGCGVKVSDFLRGIGL